MKSETICASLSNLCTILWRWLESHVFGGSRDDPALASYHLLHFFLWWCKTWMKSHKKVMSLALTVALLVPGCAPRRQHCLCVPHILPSSGHRVNLYYSKQTMENPRIKHGPIDRHPDPYHTRHRAATIISKIHFIRLTFFMIMNEVEDNAHRSRSYLRSAHENWL